jgi:membrane protein implicated in regulation of membrane protease activity
MQDAATVLGSSSWLLFAIAGVVLLVVVIAAVLIAWRVRHKTPERSLDNESLQPTFSTSEEEMGLAFTDFVNPLADDDEQLSVSGNDDFDDGGGGEMI